MWRRAHRDRRGEDLLHAWRRDRHRSGPHTGGEGKTVVTLFLLRSINLKLRPKLLQELQPGTGWSRTPLTWGTGDQRRKNRCRERTMTRGLISATSFSFGRF